MTRRNTHARDRDRQNIDRGVLTRIRSLWKGHYREVFDTLGGDVAEGATSTDPEVVKEVCRDVGLRPEFWDGDGEQIQRLARNNLLKMVAALSQWMDDQAHKDQKQITVAGEVTWYGIGKNGDRHTGTVTGRCGDERVKMWFVAPPDHVTDPMMGQVYIVSGRVYRASLEEDGTLFGMSTSVQAVMRVPDELSDQFRPGGGQVNTITGGSCPFCESELTAESPTRIWCQTCIDTGRKFPKDGETGNLLHKSKVTTKGPPPGDPKPMIRRRRRSRSREDTGEG